MGQKTLLQSEPHPGRDERLWWLVGLAALLMLVCLALITINAGAGFVVDGGAQHYWLESKITNYPFCPPSVPCPVSVILPQNHFVVWVAWQTDRTNGVKTGYRKLIDIPLPR